MEALTRAADSVRVPIDDASGVAAARRAAAELATRLGFGDSDGGRATLLASEAASNVHKHAGRGALLLTAHSGSAAALEIVAVDAGPGFEADRAARDGYTTSGTMGAGLGAMRRMASRVDIYTQPGRGSVVRLVVAAGGERMQPPRIEFGAATLPHPGETHCGDSWAARIEGEQALFVVADGLGHGPEAQRASQAATASPPPPSHGAARVVHDAHGALRVTRGAAMAAAVVDLAARRVGYAGVGNIAGMLTSPGATRHLVSLPGIVGHHMRRVPSWEHALEPDALLVMHSDGLGTHWSLDDSPGLRDQHPSVIAAVLARDHARGRDDVAVLVAREARGARP